MLLGMKFSSILLSIHLLLHMPACSRLWMVQQWLIFIGGVVDGFLPFLYFKKNPIIIIIIIINLFIV